MAKIVVQHDVDPAIGIVLEYTEKNDRDRGRGWRGSCTECGHVVHGWIESNAVVYAKQHVDSHVAQVRGVDPSSVIRHQPY